MKHYPSIPRFFDRVNDYLGNSCIAFEKLDGSNIRAEWSRKQGWYKFGTRKTMIGGDSAFKEAVDLIRDTADIIPLALDNPKFPFVAFFEFLGDNSMAGFHIPEDPKRIVLIDVSLYKQGMLSPYEFNRLFMNVSTPKVVYEGILTHEFVNSVKRGEIGSFEGVVVKGIDGKMPWMTKIKSDAWLAEVRRKGLPED